jgi:hypothetical protein
MKRVEIIANNSVEENLIEDLEREIEAFQYSLFPVTHGKGRQGSRLGDVVWPEENLILISYVDDLDAQRAREVVARLKARFPKEGIKIYSVAAD